WRIIHEESGMEISGDSNGSLTRSSSQLRADISSMPGGNLILIVQALSEGGDVTTVKSRRINYPGPFIPVESILLQPSSEECRIGENITISATVLPENATDKTLTWTSSDESIATVSAEGVVIAKAVGDAVITATCGSVSATCDVHVLPILVESIVIDPTEWSGEEGSEFKISAVVLPERATDKTLTFESSDNTVATVDTEGNVKVLKEGTCVITVLTVDGSDLTAECVITSLSGVEAIFGDSSAEVDVYDMNGILLKKGCTREELKRLKPGIYILRSGDTIVKTILR
ncbi:MAG: Ig-like domain-containing protein, partial [Muribaculaceae bacterium]|nr:Ig-like domain-containing protein [Muribaculaceae bacterium]